MIMLFKIDVIHSSLLKRISDIVAFCWKKLLKFQHYVRDLCEVFDININVRLNYIDNKFTKYFIVFHSYIQIVYKVL